MMARAAGGGGAGVLARFTDLEQLFRFSKFLAESPLLPEAFRGNVGSVMIALNMAQRLQMDPLMVMQNIVIVHGNAGLSGKMTIAMLNRSPKYRRIRYEYVNGKDYRGGMRVVGYRADDPEGADPDVGTAITPEMAAAEGWSKNAKWKTMPEQMLRYRAASFFARAFVPEELLGMQTAEELEDAEVGRGVRNVTPRGAAGGKAAAVPSPLGVVKPEEAATEEAKAVDAADAYEWLWGTVCKQDKARWSDMLKVLAAVGFALPEAGDRATLEGFAASVKSDEGACRALRESGFDVPML